MDITIGLHHFINKLSEADYNNFVKSLSAGSGRRVKSDKGELVKCLRGNPSKDERTIFIQWKVEAPGSGSYKQFKEIQKELLQLVVIHDLHVNPFSYQHQFEQEMMIADRLVVDGFHDLAYKQYKSICEAIAFDQQNYLHGLLLRKMLMIRNSIRHADRDEAFDWIESQELALTADLTQLSAIYYLYLGISKRVIKNKFIIRIEDKKLIREQLTGSLQAIDENTLSFMGKSFLLKTKTHLYRTTNDLEEAFQNQNRFVQHLLQQELRLKRNKPILLYIETIDLADLANRTGRTELCIRLIHQSEDYLTLLKDKVQIRTLYKQNLQTLIALKQGEPGTLRAHAYELLNAYVSVDGRAIDDHAPILICTMMKAFLRLHEHERVNEIYQMLPLAYKTAETQKSDQPKADIRQDYYIVNHLIYACNAYASIPVRSNGVFMEIPETFSSIAAQIKLIFRGNEEEQPLEKAVVKTWQEFGHSNRCDFQIQTLGRLLKMLDNLPFVGYFYQEQVYDIFDIRNWIIEQINRIKSAQAAA